WALLISTSASRWDSPGSAIRSSTSRPNPCGMAPTPTVLSTQFSGGIARASRAATYCIALRKLAAYPAANNLSLSRFLSGMMRLSYHLSLSRLTHCLPWIQAHPEVMQGTAEFHHEITDPLLPQADPVLHDTTTLDAAVDMLDP